MLDTYLSVQLSLHYMPNTQSAVRFRRKNIQPTCEFILDYEDEDDEDDTGRARRRKKPWRYRWPDDIRDEVLARLLALNAERAAEEQRSGAAATPKKRATKAKAKPTSEPKLETRELF